MTWKEMKRKAQQIGQDISVLTVEGSKEVKKNVTPALMKAGVQVGFFLAKIGERLSKAANKAVEKVKE